MNVHGSYQSIPIGIYYYNRSYVNVNINYKSICSGTKTTKALNHKCIRNGTKTIRALKCTGECTTRKKLNIW